MLLSETLSPTSCPGGFVGLSSPQQQQRRCFAPEEISSPDSPLVPRGRLRPPSGDAFLSRSRLQPEAWFGPISALLEEELGEDLGPLLGRHRDTLALVSVSVLEGPKGENGLRALLRHLRAVLGRDPGHGRELLERTKQAEQVAAASETELARAQQEFARFRASADGEIASLRQQLERERRSREAEREEMHKRFAQADYVADSAMAEWSLWWQERARRDQQELAHAQGMLAHESAERVRLQEELSRVRMGLLERGAQMISMNESLRIGAEWLGGGGCGGGLSPSGAATYVGDGMGLPAKPLSFFGVGVE